MENRHVDTEKWVKVSIQGAPYLRKVNLRAYRGYRELMAALFCFVRTFNWASQQWGMLVAYEDEAGHSMLAGDLPWDMFVDSCVKLLICKMRLP
ncbi:auxin-responsive protein IAA14-like [Triticum aestivum]|uniref:auxin-responsive protein IAA14-like n=1 Tax=Triticum aestivum TaxID=4565 RepID=UPI001D029BC4|nr:auxin-responsive protein IAA14-like [Triticum aestivum]